MAKVTGKGQTDIRIAFEISEAEARAIDALAGYGSDAFLATFKKHMGTSYMEGHEDGLREFFKTMRESIPPFLDRADKARAVFKHPELLEGTGWRNKP